MTARRPAVALAAAGVALLAVVPSAAAIAPCAGGAPAATPVLTGQGVLESVIVDARGRLYYTDTDARELRRLDAPGARPETVASGIDAPGGLAIDGQGRILVGRGDGIVPGLQGNVVPAAGLLRVDPETKLVETFATGLQMANGVVRAADGTVFASSDVGFGIDRVDTAGTVQTRWATVFSANGLAIDRAQRYLYAAQTFQPAAISRIDLRDSSRVETFATPPADGIAAGPDGMTIDGADRLYVAAQLSGEIWRVDTADRSVCAIGTGVTNPSAVAFGQGDRGFSRGRLFSVGFDGVVAEIPGAKVTRAAEPPVPDDVPAAAAPARGTDRVVFSPARVTVRRGIARFTPRVTLVRANGARRVLVRRVRLPGGRVVRSGRPVAVRVTPGARSLPVRFVVRRVVRTRTVTLRRG